jgi:DNA gyrase subunit B
MTFFYRQMPRLVAEGHLYVAQPPLYMISSKKERRYVHHEDQMQAILMDTGLAGAQLDLARPSAPATADNISVEGQGGPSTAGIHGDRLKSLVELVSAIELGLRSFGRRNRPLREFLAMAHSAMDPKLDPRAGLLPQFLIEDPRHEPKEFPCWTEQECDDYRHAHEAEFATESEFEKGTKETKETVQENTESPAGENAAAAPTARYMVRRTELHEVKTLNKHLTRLRDDFGLRADVLLPREITGDEPPPRFILERESESYPLLDLRTLVATVRKIGEKGIKITRFKGLGEMDAEQLWETTMDPSRRTLMQVRLDDVASANDLFTTLMGDDVEPRREFIEKHALEVKNLDV